MAFLEYVNTRLEYVKIHLDIGLIGADEFTQLSHEAARDIIKGMPCLQEADATAITRALVKGPLSEVDNVKIGASLRSKVRGSSEGAAIASKLRESNEVEKCLLSKTASYSRQMAIWLLASSIEAKLVVEPSYDDPVRAAKAAADAYEKFLAELKTASEATKLYWEEIRVGHAVRDALALSCMSIVGMRDSDAFYSTVAEALGRELLEVEESQIGNSYKNLMKEVPGHFASQSDLRKRMRRKPGKGTGIEAGSKPDQADGEAANAPDIKSVRTTKSKKEKLESTAAEAAASAADVQSFQPAFVPSAGTAASAAHDLSFQPAYVPVSLCNQSSLSQPARDWHYGYQDCNGLWHIASAVSTDEDFVQVEQNVAEMDPLNGAMIRRFFDKRYYGAYVIRILQSLSTTERLYIVQYQGLSTEILQQSVVQQGVEDLANPSAPQGYYGKKDFFLQHEDHIPEATATMKEFAKSKEPHLTATLNKFGAPSIPERTPEDGDM